MANPYATGEIELPDLFGGQFLFADMDDGGTLCETCIRDETNPVHPDDGSNDGWGIVGFDGTANCEGFLACDHCSRVLIEEEE